VYGQSASAVYVADGRQAVLLGTTRQLLGRDFGLARQFLYAGSIGPLPLMQTERDQLVQLGDELAQRFGLMGLFNVDFLRYGRGLWVLEVNPRYSASVEILERLTSAAFVALHMAACEQQALPPGSPTMAATFAGKAVVYAEREGSLPPAFDDLVARWNLPLSPPGIADLPRIGDVLSPGQPVATVFAAGDTSDAVENELRSRVSEVLSVLNNESN
jgi:predicted ATP-grasp superfamily ATP-dependent carboligase